MGEHRSGERTIRLVIVDDHRVLQESLALLLDRQTDMEVVGVAGDGASAAQVVAAALPDVVLMDVSLPDMSGVEATRAVLAAAPSVRVIGLSMHDEDGVMQAMREAGAVAYRLKDGPADLLLAAIREHAGR